MKQSEACQILELGGKVRHEGMPPNNYLQVVDGKLHWSYPGEFLRQHNMPYHLEGWSEVKDKPSAGERLYNAIKLSWPHVTSEWKCLHESQQCDWERAAADFLVSEKDVV